MTQSFSQLRMAESVVDAQSTRQALESQLAEQNSLVNRAALLESQLREELARERLKLFGPTSLVPAADAVGHMAAMQDQLRPQLQAAAVVAKHGDKAAGAGKVLLIAGVVVLVLVIAGVAGFKFGGKA